MLQNYLLAQMVQFREEVHDWEEAIRAASEPLLKNDSIKNEYIQQMIENVKSHGPYIVILPRFAMPHSRPEDGVNKLGLSFLKVEKGVEFPGGKIANVFLVLAAPDSDSHLALLSELSTILSNEEKVNALVSAKNYQDILLILQEESK